MTRVELKVSLDNDMIWVDNVTHNSLTRLVWPEAGAFETLKCNDKLRHNKVINFHVCPWLGSDIVTQSDQADTWSADADKT